MRAGSLYQNYPNSIIHCKSQTNKMHYVEHFWVFAMAAMLLNLTPGNDMMYVAARSTSQGVKAGIISSLGIMAGCMVHIVAAVVGLSAIIAGSAVAFNTIKYLGAAYLIYLGL